MKPIFTEDVAREIGYQKYRPEFVDWVVGTAVCISALVLFAAFLSLALKILSV
jgi:hypothetical protein